MNIEEISHIKGFGSSDKILNLLATIENQLYGLDLDIENFVGFEKIYFTIGFPQKIKIEVGHGQKTERAQQKNSQQKQSHQCRETEIQQNARTILDASYQGNGGQGSQGKSSATRILSEFFYDIKYEFDRQHVYKRTDNKLEVHIFEYFKYLDFSSGNCEIYNHLSHHLVNLKYYICSHRREEQQTGYPI